MSIGGGRTARGLRTARAMPLVLAALLTLPTLVPTAPAQAGTDPWWGPSDRSRPTDGWAVRVPVVIENKFSYPMANPLVAVDLDFGALLIAAGWTNQSRSGATTLRGFTLDVDSIRVVPYQRGFSGGPLEGSSTQPVPHRFYEAPFEAARHRPFDATQNPSGTVLFTLSDYSRDPAQADVLRPGEKRFFYVYANPVEYGDLPPAQFSLKASAPLDSYLWASQGTTYYGYEPQQGTQSQLLQIRALDTSAPTTVTVSQFTGGRFTPIPASVNFPNPFQIRSGSASFYVPSGVAFKVEADKPIVVAGHGKRDANNNMGSSEAWGYVPATSGSFAGTEFNAFTFFNLGSGSSRLTLIAAEPGVTTVTFQDPDTGSSPVGPVTLSASSPAQSVLLSGYANRWLRVLSDKPILVSMHPQLADADDIVHTVQVPALTGGPVGTSFVAPLTSDNGFFRVCPERALTLRVESMSTRGLQVYPEGTTQTAPPQTVEATGACREVAASSATPAHPFEFYSTKEDRYPVPDAPGPFRLVVGAHERSDLTRTRGPVGHFGGPGGVDVYAFGRTGILGHYNNTRIVVQEERVVDGKAVLVNRSPISINRDGFHQVDPNATAGATGQYRLLSNKPITVVSTEAAAHAFARYVPGRMPNPDVTVGRAEFRGPLVELRAPDDPARRVLIRSTGPDTPVSFRLDVLNLGRWIGGESLPDAIEVSCVAPAGWTVQGCAREVTLGTGQAERLEVTVTPGNEPELPVARTVQVTARSKSGGPVATFDLRVQVEIRYGVGMWFDVEDGRKRIDPPIGLDPGETYRYNVLLKNTGSASDEFTLTVDPAPDGWTQALLLDGAPVDRVRLDAGAARTLAFEVTAPDAETGPQSFVSIAAQSVSSALANDKVDTATRIRPKVDIRLQLDTATRLAAPNETATFNVSVANSGNDIFRILFRQESVLPEGWRATLSVDEIDLSPNTEAPFQLQLRVTPPPGARAGDLATLKLVAATDTGGGSTEQGDEVSAVVVVRKVHDVTTPAALDAAADPGAALPYVLPLSNRGNGNDAVELLPGATSAALVVKDGQPLDNATASAGWRVTAPTGGLVLPYNASADMPLQVQVPPGAPPGTYNVTFTVRLSREAFQNLTIPIEVRTLPRVELRLPVATPDALALRASPGRAREVALVAVNTGNVPGEFALAADAPEGWDVAFAPARVTLAPGERAPVTLRLNVSGDAEDGRYDVALLALLGGAPAGRTPAPTTVARPEVFLSAVDATGRLRAGELVVVSATVGNRGDADAENVSVALAVDDRVVDRVTLQRVRVNESAVATLSWVATGRGGAVRVLLDPEQEIVQASRDETVATVEFGSLVPGPAPLALLAAVAALALLRRRRRA